MQCRTSSRDEYITKPPRFRFVLEYHAAVYDPKRGAVYEGEWSDLHFWIARDKGVAEASDSWNGVQRYLSCDVFALRAVPGVRVAIIDTMYGFKARDLSVFEKLGYTVMSPDHEWLVRDDFRAEGFVRRPSSLVS